MKVTLAVIEAVIAGSGAGDAIGALLPEAARSRQLTAGTLLAGMMLALADGRPAHLTRVLEASSSPTVPRQQTCSNCAVS